MRRHHRRIQENTREYFYIRNINNTRDVVVLQDGNYAYNADIEYSRDMTNWTTIPKSTFATSTTIDIDPNEKIYFRGTGTRCDGSVILRPDHNEFEVGGYLSSLFKSSSCFTDNTLTEDDACAGMFSGSNVVRANNLIFPNNVTNGCYNYMFGNCKILEETPVILPAQTLRAACYLRMFNHCSGIVEAPILPAEHLASQCYEYMFEYCTNLRYIECHSLDDMTGSYCTNWLTSTSGEGVFIKDVHATWTSQNANYGVPVGWTIFKGDPYECPFYIEDRSGRAQTVWFNLTGQSDIIYEGSYDQSSWSTLTGPSVNLIPYGKTYIRLKTGTQGTFPYQFRSSDGNFAIGGSLLSLLTRDFATVKHDYTGMQQEAFLGSFYECTSLISAIGLHFINKASIGCYREMFYHSGLYYPPHKLPAETLVVECYCNMFYDCYHLVVIPKLPAKTVPTNAYREMFGNCGSLTRAKIYAETIDGDSLIGMFAGCGNLEWIDAPILSADSSHTNGFTHGVSGSGTFIKNAEATWSTTGDSGVPNGWSTVMRYV